MKELINAYFTPKTHILWRTVFKTHLVVGLVLWGMCLSFSQTPNSVLGYSGLVITPTAEIMEDGQLAASISRIPKLYADNYKPYDRTCFVVAMGFMPFMEATMGFIRPDNFQGGVGDRTVSVRLRLLKEKGGMPAIALGLHDFFAIEEFELEPADAQHFTSSYIVVTKHYNMFFNSQVGLNLGYGLNWLPSNDRQLTGLFGGLLVSPIKQVQLMLEHDGVYANAGMRFHFFRRVNYMMSFWRLKYMMHQISFSISLS